MNGENSTMTVTFKGGIEGKNQKMTTTITGIKARDYHIVTFMKKVDESGNVSVGIEIDGLVADVELDNDAQGEESGDGNDPDAPVGDGGIDLVSTCEYNISNPVNVPAVGPFSFTMKAQVPNGTLKFTVDIESTNEDFINSVNTVGGTKLDLINPSEANLLRYSSPILIASTPSILINSLINVVLPVCGIPVKHNIFMFNSS